MVARQQSGSNRMVLLLVAGIPITIMLMATWLWYYVVEGELDLVGILGTSNTGSLVQPPRELEGLDLTEAGSLPFHYSELEPKWTFLIPGGASCDATCEKVLYTTRQIHIAMGKEFNRIRRIHLSDRELTDTQWAPASAAGKSPAPLTFSEFLAGEHRGMKALKIAPGHYQALLSEYLSEPSTWYLVDPAGWIMMSYDSDDNYKGVMSDLKFLLKNSGE